MIRIFLNRWSRCPICSQQFALCGFPTIEQMIEFARKVSLHKRICREEFLYRQIVGDEKTDWDQIAQMEG
jgi:hypothetical protein